MEILLMDVLASWAARWRRAAAENSATPPIPKEMANAVADAVAVVADVAAAAAANADVVTMTFFQAVDHVVMNRMLRQKRHRRLFPTCSWSPFCHR